MILTSTKGQDDLPRYFAPIFDKLQTIPRGRCEITLPDGRVFRVEGQEAGYEAELQVHNPDLFARIIREGDMGFCEAYMDGWWSTPDLMAFMDLIHDDAEDIYDGFPGQFLVRFYERMRFWMQRNSKKQARKNISYHYDLGNEFYGLWLDETMTYSSAKYETDDETLAQAQRLKYKSMVDQMGVERGDHVLEIGCGWGGFSEYAAAERGLHVTGLTISQEQHDFAVARMAAAGLSDMVTIKMQDYRDEAGQYDGIASIEMFEAVGEEYWPSYFATLHKCLKPGKSATLQIITVAHRRWQVYKRGVDFIQKYIFPGGMLPSPVMLREEVEKAGLRTKGSIEFGESYSKTLRIWYDDFNAEWSKIEKMGFDDRFRRMWNFYLTSCAATFHSGNCDVTQITVTRDA